MQIIRSIDAYYPSFFLGAQPLCVPCQLSIVEANGKRYLKTPFAMLNAYADDDIERQIGKGYYATKEDCQTYLDAEYPNWQAAQPIMDALCRAVQLYGKFVGEYHVADKLRVNVDQLYKIARGHRSCSKIRSTAKLLATD